MEKELEKLCEMWQKVPPEKRIAVLAYAQGIADGSESKDKKKEDAA